jgi:hypothetical protein
VGLMDPTRTIETRTHAWNTRVGLELGGKQDFWYKEFRHLWIDRERLGHRFLELPPIRCPQPSYTNSEAAIPPNDMDSEKRTKASGVEVRERFPEHSGRRKHWLASIILRTRLSTSGDHYVLV